MKNKILFCLWHILFFASSLLAGRDRSTFAQYLRIICISSVMVLSWYNSKYTIDISAPSYWDMKPESKTDDDILEGFRIIIWINYPVRKFSPIVPNTMFYSGGRWSITLIEGVVKWSQLLFSNPFLTRHNSKFWISTVYDIRLQWYRDSKIDICDHCTTP